MKGDYTFGQLLRANRVGFYWSDWLKCGIRITIGLQGFMCADGAIVIELCPLDQIPAKSGLKYHVCWNDDGGSVLKMCPALVGIGPIDKPLTIYVDNAGNKLV